jgi:hypothetical protein
VAGARELRAEPAGQRRHRVRFDPERASAELHDARVA